MSARGSALATTLVLMVVLALICAAITRLLMSRATLENKMESNVSLRVLSTEGIQSAMMNCMQQQPAGNSCSQMASTCAGSINIKDPTGKTITVTNPSVVSNGPPCQISFTVNRQ